MSAGWPTPEPSVQQRMRQELHDKLDWLIEHASEPLHYPLVFTVTVEAPIVGAVFSERENRVGRLSP